MTDRHLVLNPNARLLWRSAQAVQVELGARRVVVDGIAPQEVATLLHGGVDGERSEPDEDPSGARSPRITNVRGQLASAGLMMSTSEAVRHPGPPRLETELGALRTRRGALGADLLGARSENVVLMQGVGRLSAQIGAVLAAAGVGHVSVRAEGLARLNHCAPGGLRPADEGARFTAAATEALHRAAPEVDAAPPSGHRAVDLVILAGDGLIDPDTSDALHRLGQAHLVAWAGGDHGIVGPLVVPGLSSCLHCADLQRLDRDNAWSALAAQLSLTTRHPPATDTALATMVAGLASLQALAYLDGAEVTTIDATLEFQLPDWRLRRRSWNVHPRCDCQLASTAARRR